MDNDGDELFKIKENVRCTKCGCKGAVKSYGVWYSKGMGDKALKLPSVYHKYKDQSRMSYMMGPGGTIPYRCLNCGNVGLIDIDGLECHKKAFETIEETNKE